MTKFKVGDKVRLTAKAREYFKTVGWRKIQYWEGIYLKTDAVLTVIHIYKGFDPPQYAIEGIGIGIYEYDLEESEDV